MYVRSNITCHVTCLARLVAVPSDPPVRGRRSQAQRREQTRGALIAATIRAIAEQGYTATTTRRVAELAGWTLGALAHHFRSRQDLIVATIDEVGRRSAEELREQLAAVPAEQREGSAAALDVMWRYYLGDLFIVWLRVWLAAAEDPDLYQRLVPLQRQLSEAITLIADDLAPTDLARHDWHRRFAVALNTMRGLALGLRIEPRPSTATTDPWPATRTELTRLLDHR